MCPTGLLRAAAVSSVWPCRCPGRAVFCVVGLVVLLFVFCELRPCRWRRPQASAATTAATSRKVIPCVSSVHADCLRLLSESLATRRDRRDEASAAHRAAKFPGPTCDALPVQGGCAACPKCLRTTLFPQSYAPPKDFAARRRAQASEGGRTKAPRCGPSKLRLTRRASSSASRVSSGAITASTKPRAAAYCASSCCS